MGLQIDKEQIMYEIDRRTSCFEKEKNANKSREIHAAYLSKEIKRNCSFHNQFLDDNVYCDKSYADCVFENCGFADVVFENCIFVKCKFKECRFDKVIFRNCIFWNNFLKDTEIAYTIRREDTRDSYFFESPCYFTKSQFFGTEFRDCDLSYAIYEDVLFHKVKFNESRMIKSLLYKCDLEKCESNKTTHASSTFYETGKFDINFRYYGKNIFDRNTIFHCAEIAEYKLNTLVVEMKDLSTKNEGTSFIHNLFTAINRIKRFQSVVLAEKHSIRYSTYLQIKNIFEEMGHSDLSGEYYYLGKKEERKSLSGIGRIFSLITAVLCGYGERPSYTFFVILVDVLLFGLFYLFSGFSVGYNNIINFSAVQAAWPNIVEVFKLYCHSVFFSVTTFSTVGYGNYVPVGPISSTLAAIQMLMGVSLTALWTGCIFRKISR